MLSRGVNVVLLPVGDGTATQALRRLRAAAATDRDDVPRILDLAVVDGCPVAVLMAGDGPPDLDTLVAVSCGAPAAGVPVGRPLAVDDAHLVSAKAWTPRPAWSGWCQQVGPLPWRARRVRTGGSVKTWPTAPSRSWALCRTVEAVGTGVSRVG